MFVPDESLITLQMQTRIRQCYERKQMLESDLNFLDTVITGDEIWVDHFDPLTKSAISLWKLETH